MFGVSAEVVTADWGVPNTEFAEPKIFEDVVETADLGVSIVELNGVLLFGAPVFDGVPKILEELVLFFVGSVKFDGVLVFGANENSTVALGGCTSTLLTSGVEKTKFSSLQPMQPVHGAFSKYA